MCVLSSRQALFEYDIDVPASKPRQDNSKEPTKTLIRSTGQRKKLDFDHGTLKSRQSTHTCSQHIISQRPRDIQTQSYALHFRAWHRRQSIDKQCNTVDVVEAESV
jgi:hypothetical protein